MSVLLDMRENYYNSNAYDEEDYRKISIASWVEKVVGKNAKTQNTTTCFCYLQTLAEMDTSQQNNIKRLLFMTSMKINI